MTDYEKLKEFILYNPISGSMTWRIDHSGRKKGGLVGKRFRLKYKKYSKSIAAYILAYREKPNGRIYFKNNGKNKYAENNMFTLN